MLIADALGIYVGIVAGRKIPERVIKWISALIFIAFGYIGLYTSVPKEYLSVPNISILIGLTLGAVYFLGRQHSGTALRESKR